MLTMTFLGQVLLQLTYNICVHIRLLTNTETAQRTTEYGKWMSKPAKIKVWPALRFVCFVQVNEINQVDLVDGISSTFQHREQKISERKHNCVGVCDLLILIQTEVSLEPKDVTAVTLFRSRVLM